jgi:glycosyltransferase involved in cell wall biosynthesis
MRITYITAGAGGMYCGSCIRDNALATALMAQGHDVLLLPMYTPTLTDEENVSAPRVFFGGVSVYLEQYLALFRHTPWLLDRLWDAPWLLRTVAGRGVQTQPEQLGGLTVSVLAGRHGHQAKEIDKLVHWLKGQPTPDVVDLSNSMLIALARPIKEALGVPVCCTLQGEDIFLDHLSEPYRGQALQLIQDSLAHVDRFIAVSDYYAVRMCSYLGIPGAKIDVVPLGINQTGYEPLQDDMSNAGSDDRFIVGYFGRIAPEKGTHLLCEALKRLRQDGQHENTSLRLAGYLAPEHRAFVESLEDQIRTWGLAGHVRYEGTLDREQKIKFFQGLDVFAIPAAYDDPKGLVLLEAMACGVPVVAPRRGTYTEMIERTGGGILVPADDLDSFVDALRMLASDPVRRRELGAVGATGVREHYTSADMATRALDVYAGLASGATRVA